jgi:hypothetical protein
MKRKATTMLIRTTDGPSHDVDLARGTIRSLKPGALKVAVLAALVLSAAALVPTSKALANDKPGYEQGQLQRMDSSSCGSKEAGSKTGSHKKTQDVLCQDYVLQTDRMVYRIRLKDAKHQNLLPVGEAAEFRIHKDSLYLRLPDSSDTKEREYIVLSVAPRSDNAESDNKASAPVR